MCNSEQHSPADQVRLHTAMYPIHKRHDDIVIQRRMRENPDTHLVRQVYGVTYPGHTDAGTELGTYAEAERLALAQAEQSAVAAWYDETPNSERSILLGNFRFVPVVEPAASGRIPV